MRSGGSSDIFVRSFPSRMSSSHTHCPGSSSPRNLANASSPSPDFDARQAATNFRVQTFARISSKTKRSTSRATAGSSPRCSRNSQRVVSCGDGSSTAGAMGSGWEADAGAAGFGVAMAGAAASLLGTPVDFRAPEDLSLVKSSSSAEMGRFSIFAASASSEERKMAEGHLAIVSSASRLTRAIASIEPGFLSFASNVRT